MFGSFLVQLWHLSIFDFTSFASQLDGSKEDAHVAQNVAVFKCSLKLQFQVLEGFLCGDDF